MKKTIRPILRDDLSRKGLENVSTCVYISTAAKRNLRLPIRLPRLAGIRNPDVLSETAPKKRN